MFELAISAALPIIGVHTDDPVNRVRVLQSIAGGKPVELKSTASNLTGAIYWTENSDLVTPALYEKFHKEDKTLVVFNPEGESSLILDTGILPTPPEFLFDLLEHYVNPLYVKEVSLVLKGLSLKSAEEVLKLTQARTNDKPTASTTRQTRGQIGEQVQGLNPIDTTYDFYDFPEALQDWLVLNRKYFLSPKTPTKLVPRGVLMDGPPGVGKSMGAKAIAQFLGVPLYRLDIASTLNRYIGESEARVNRALALLEREGPCVLLLDEIEKVFLAGSDDMVITRIMSQLLWWLAEHQSRIITVMTTNNVSVIPPELYREGRVDLVLQIHRLGPSDAHKFANTVLKGILGKASVAHTSKLVQALKATGNSDHSHAEVAELVYTQVKANNWLDID